MIRLTSLALATTLLAWPSITPQQQVFRSTADSVPVFVTVRDKAGRLVTNLTREDFQVFDNGKPQQVTLFDNTPQPIRIITLLDLSGSMSLNLPLMRAAVKELLAHLASDDLARVGTFGVEVKLSPTFTTSLPELLAMIPDQIPRDAPTPLWRSVDESITEFNTAPGGRRVILVLSDGKDSGYIPGQKFYSSIEIEERAQREDVMVYGVGLRSSPAPISSGGIQNLGAMMGSTLPDPALGTVALNTGGGYFELRGGDNLAASFARVVEELHSQYLLGFAPPARDGKTHKLEIKTKDGGLKPQARKTYLAPK